MVSVLFSMGEQENDGRPAMGAFSTQRIGENQFAEPDIWR
jgi:hypothetical protein